MNNSDTTVSSGTNFRYIETSFNMKQDGEIVIMFYNRETHWFILYNKWLEDNIMASLNQIAQEIADSFRNLLILCLYKN